MLKDQSHVIIPNWQMPEHVKAFTTTRLLANGICVNENSNPAYAANNLALHVGDNTNDVLANRQRLKKEFVLPSEPFWLNQTHTTKVVDVVEGVVTEVIEADASYTNKVNQVSVVMTADCLPILLCDRAGTQVAAVHAGWRGLLGGIIENAIEKFSTNENSKKQHGKNEIVAWLGPAIGPDAFEVGDDVRNLFVEKNADAIVAFQLMEQSSQSFNERKWLADIYALARLRLNAQGVNEIYGGDFCTYNDDTRFYSYRRDNTCGRMATMIWLG